MIVADANLIAYYVLRGEFRAPARRCRRRDPDWVAPAIWRLELLGVLARHLRSIDPIFQIGLDEANLAYLRATTLVREWPEPIAPRDVLAAVSADGISAYDAHYAIVARAAGARVVTLDRPLRRRLPDLCISIQDFASGQ